MFGPVTVSINLENIVVAVCAVIALIFAGKQFGFLVTAQEKEAERARIASEKEAERERIAADQEGARQRASAEDLWRRYGLLCIQYPDLAYTKESTFEFGTETGRLDGERLKFTRYEYFVSFLLYAIEEIHYAFPNETDWENAIWQELWWHKTYLTSDYFRPWLETNNKYIQDLIDKLRSEK